ncbi:MAG: 4Fe-4S dicluster domain-containing protein [Anaerolineales bacterium]|nr:4Fe-4S dicluster domain-containing protein [Anaerolineales bacterium]
MPQKNHFGFVIDVSRCIDCRACLVSCSVENAVPMNHTRIWVHDLGLQGEFPDLRRTFIPYNCMHCDNPPCIQVCTSGATYKDKETGLVLVNQEACIGCGFCVEACPYDARYLDEKRGVVDKCNACDQRLVIGQKPACVATCLGGARMFGDLNDSNSEAVIALKNANSILQRLDIEYEQGTHTHPNIYYINSDENLNARLEPHQPQYTLAEQSWRKFFLPAVLVGVGATVLGQAIMFTKQLLQGESEFEDR